MAKAVDILIRDRHVALWNSHQVSTQFQGEGSSHELAALLLSECIQYSLYTLKKPIYALYLDAKSAFDVVQRELLIKNLFHIQGASQSLIYIDRRLARRETVVEWDGQLMGPIDDEQGLEQGGVSSSDFYKIFAQEQLLLAQNSKLGIKLPTETISAIGEADDTVLLANSIDDLYLLLELTNSFSLKYRVDLCAEKTKLQILKPKEGLIGLMATSITLLSLMGNQSLFPPLQNMWVLSAL